MHPDLGGVILAAEPARLYMAGRPACAKRSGVGRPLTENGAAL